MFQDPSEESSDHRLGLGASACTASSGSQALDRDQRRTSDRDSDRLRRVRKHDAKFTSFALCSLVVSSLFYGPFLVWNDVSCLSSSDVRDIVIGVLVNVFCYSM